MGKAVVPGSNPPVKPVKKKSETVPETSGRPAEKKDHWEEDNDLNFRYVGPKDDGAEVPKVKCLVYDRAYIIKYKDGDKIHTASAKFDGFRKWDKQEQVQIYTG